ncbi:hypothetical protein BU17DRAFT_98211 [Hysterangium stoloniferum]|nr:hypothetical protein BU17DRAFT_98211 [Hysterangium stoloniferum]
MAKPPDFDTKLKELGHALDESRASVDKSNAKKGRSGQIINTAAEASNALNDNNFQEAKSTTVGL